ncbi:MlaA family lipoprotein [Desulfurivibrio alkaliphilus]|uniref:VacJ family lipoprotein n=1 Tax=Desulfurivibrio alkaliphilus (strain DSM 19089 / UNIQEM U267 / AHT2) TaxID=589865 RepID=D6Z367_DESAT|nr:VacJ family lipoprotein [Desulfurivibrio alkaliphilus]ADH85992.1 VacJ family lipoprotein [Desulfurivibrio alkaliphilus AHT 2]
MLVGRVGRRRFFLDGIERRKPAGCGPAWSVLTLLLLACLLLLPVAAAAGSVEHGVDPAGPPAAPEAVAGEGEPGDLRDDDFWDDDPWDDDPWDDDPWDAGRPGERLADPLEPINRLVFKFNDRLYVRVLDPLARGYAATLPEDIRLCFRRFFRNLTAPVRVVNHLLQGRVRDSGRELLRFTVNTTIGIAGLVDPAADTFGIEQRNADFGQTLGVYGLGAGFFITWPLLGPSTLRDSVGMAGDSLVNPTSRLLMEDPRTGAVVHAGRTVNNASFHVGEYERLTGAAFDPYIAVRDAYWQYRRRQIMDRGTGPEAPRLFREAAGGDNTTVHQGY